MRLILDTNVLLSAQLSPRGAPAKLLAAWEQKRFTLVISDDLLAELREVLERPFFRARLRRSDAELFAATLHVPAGARRRQRGRVSRHRRQGSACLETTRRHAHRDACGHARMAEGP
ncbi:MAG: PIN domain-containing protein [Terriglobia bacterium]